MASFSNIIGTINPPTELGPLSGQNGISTILTRIISLFFVVSTVSFVIMFVWGATDMILSGGDKEKIAKARGRIQWAIIGIVVMALAFVVFRVLQVITGFNFILI